MQLAIVSSPITQGSHQVTSSSDASWLKYSVRTKIDLQAENVPANDSKQESVCSAFIKYLWPEEQTAVNVQDAVRENCSPSPRRTIALHRLSICGRWDKNSGEPCSEFPRLSWLPCATKVSGPAAEDECSALLFVCVFSALRAKGAASCQRICN